MWRLPILILAVLSGQSTASSEGTVVPGHADIGLHVGPSDPRPRVNVRFLCSDEPVVYSLVFDTGMPKTMVLRSEVPEPMESPPSEDGRTPLRFANEGEGYRDVDPSRRFGESREVALGVEGRVHTMCSVNRAIEMVELLGAGGESFAHWSELELTTEMHSKAVGVGLLGAARGGRFAHAAKVFTVLPPGVMPGGGAEAGTLVIGRREGLSQFCLGREMKWFDLEWPVSHWTLRGAVSVDGGPAVEVNWIVDTGAVGIALPKASYDAAMALISAGGESEVRAYSDKFNTRITNCKDYKTRFPTISIIVGDLVVPIPPMDYIIRVADDESTCYAELRSKGLPGQRGARLLGPRFLNKVVAVFDNQRNQMGLCNIAPSPN